MSQSCTRPSDVVIGSEQSQSKVDDALVQEYLAVSPTNVTADTASSESEAPCTVEPRPHPLLHIFVATVIVAGLVTAMYGVMHQLRFDFLSIAIFTGLALLTELWYVDLYNKGSISVSVAIFFAIGLISGSSGIICVSVATGLLYHFQIRPAWYKTAFNLSVHILAGAAPAFLRVMSPQPLDIANLPALLLPVALAAIAFYIINTALISIAIGLATASSALAVWREEFKWLIGHYIVLCVMGLFLSVAYTQFGLLGIIVFILPIVMMRYTQKQYVDRTEDNVRELHRMNAELVTANNAVQRLNDELFDMLARFFDARDPYVGGHAATVAKYATLIAHELGMAGEQLKQVRQAAILHDLGKIAIPDNILHKAGALTDAEYEMIKTHVTVGAELIEQSEQLRHLAPYIRYHHERWDGRGYPSGLAADQIPLVARILNLCDSVEAMASDRPYHRALTPSEVIAEVKRCAGSQFDPTIADIFVHIAEREEAKFVINSAQMVSERQASKVSTIQYGRPHLQAPRNAEL